MVSATASARTASRAHRTAATTAAAAAGSCRPPGSQRCTHAHAQNRRTASESHLSPPSVLHPDCVALTDAPCNVLSPRVSDGRRRQLARGIPVNGWPPGPGPARSEQQTPLRRERQQRGAIAIAASTWSASRWPVPWRNRDKLAERTARAEAARWSGLRLRLVHRRQVHRGVSGPSSCRRPRRCSGRRGGPPKLRPLRVTVSPSVGDDGQGRPRRPEALEGRQEPPLTVAPPRIHLRVRRLKTTAGGRQ